jgi:SPOR domain
MIGHLLLAGLLATLVAGCGSSRPGSEASGQPSASSDIRRFERDFRPSDYGREASARQHAGIDTTSGNYAPESTGTAGATDEMVQGFRVQIFSSSSIDEANSKKDEAELLFPAEWFYVEYDPPAYKIRAGNFLTRMSAEKFRDEAQEKGYRGAWVVPGRVFKQPPPPPPHTEPAPTQK